MRLIMWGGELAFLADRIDLLAEVAALEVDLVVFRVPARPHPGTRGRTRGPARRLELVRANVLGPMRALGETPRDVVR